MKYFLDQEFIEGFYKPRFSHREPHHFIQLISIGLVAEDGREYYAVSKDFDLNATWKNEWVRNNVLKPIWKELEYLDFRSHKVNKYNRPFYQVLDELPEAARVDFYHDNIVLGQWEAFFSKTSLRHLLKKYGKSTKEISQNILEFVAPASLRNDGHMGFVSVADYLSKNPTEFYAYFADYDWVLFCSLFGSMMDLPKGFPMYCKDLKQYLDDAVLADHEIKELLEQSEKHNLSGYTFEQLLDIYVADKHYPKQTNEHNALADARWNKKLHDYLNEREKKHLLV